MIGWAFGAGTTSREPAERDADIKAAVALAKQSDVAVLVLGDDLHSSSEWGDRDNLGGGLCVYVWEMHLGVSVGLRLGGCFACVCVRMCG